VKIVPTTSIVVMLALLAGCAGVTTGVETQGALPAAHQPPASYRLERTAAQQALPVAPPYEAALRDALAQHGFVPAAEGAKYLVSVSWATRPADIEIGTDDCRQDCLPPTPPLFPWFGRQYLHQLTVRFFALPDGAPVYKVTAVKRDRDADAQAALPYLVASALAKLPDAGATPWRVKLDDAPVASRALPRVVSVAPAAPH
jgi:hypothetical protein